MTLAKNLGCDLQREEITICSFKMYLKRNRCIVLALEMLHTRHHISELMGLGARAALRKGLSSAASLSATNYFTLS